jgi:hypothetical protein
VDQVADCSARRRCRAMNDRHEELRWRARELEAKIAENERRQARLKCRLRTMVATRFVLTKGEQQQLARAESADDFKRLIRRIRGRAQRRSWPVIQRQRRIAPFFLARCRAWQPRQPRTCRARRPSASGKAPDPDPAGKGSAVAGDDSRTARWLDDNDPRPTKTQGRAGCLARFFASHKPLASPGLRGGAPCDRD